MSVEKPGKGSTPADLSMIQSIEFAVMIDFESPKRSAPPCPLPVAHADEVIE